jgi:hypothetical protein
MRFTHERTPASSKALMAGGEPIEILGDRDLLFDAISNLVDNAITPSNAKKPVLAVWAL